MELCVGVEYMKFRATCKHCYFAAPLNQWSSKTSKRLQLYSLVKSPWLMVLDTYRNIITFIDPIYGEKYFIKTPQELKGTWDVYVHFVSGESSWLLDSLDFGSDHPYSFDFPTFNGRDIYALCNNKRIEAFRDIADDDFTWDEVTNNVPIKSSADYFLSSCDQHLLLVIVGAFGESVEVFKLKDSSDGWEKIDGLGKHMIYISNTSCICLEAKSPEMGNKIYFPRLLHNDDRKIAFYSLETRKYHTFDDNNIQESFGTDLFKTNYLCYPHTWIEPSWP
ncbi:hypothetical protein HanPI659440_Chr00c05g0714381 [Helianthus annuus]|nr:hypothetical protein HanPI659440_Chr00c05g0714381 [Helianthus annuus]